MVPCRHWTPARINEVFATANEPLSTLKRAEKNFDNKSPSMLATDYHEDHPLAFYSHKLTDTQTWYTMIKLELLAIIKTL
jgi:RNase H-like domain found in reverse transcriptase